MDTDYPLALIDRRCIGTEYGAGHELGHNLVNFRLIFLHPQHPYATVFYLKRRVPPMILLQHQKVSRDGTKGTFSLDPTEEQSWRMKKNIFLKKFPTEKYAKSSTVVPCRSLFTILLS